MSCIYKILNLRNMHFFSLCDCVYVCIFPGCECARKSQTASDTVERWRETKRGENPRPQNQREDGTDLQWWDGHFRLFKKVQLVLRGTSVWMLLYFSHSLLSSLGAKPGGQPLGRLPFWRGRPWTGLATELWRRRSAAPAGFGHE